MGNLETAAVDWLRTGDEWIRFSRASMALQLALGMDLGVVLNASAEARRALLPRIRRALRREHLRGVAHHWSYDLNRHIALKQALDYVSLKTAPQKKTTAPRVAVVSY